MPKFQITGLAIAIPVTVLFATPFAPVVAASSPAPPSPGWTHCQSVDPETGDMRIDPACFLDVLVERYRRLTVYHDTADVLEVTRRTGEEPRRVVTRVGCEVSGDRLRVETPSSRLRERVGLDMPYKTSPAMELAALQYRMWLAPHMALKFIEEPERDFRSGVDEGFTATEASEVVIDDGKPMLKLELRSGDGESASCDAHFDLYVNPESMLVERIDGAERLPGGGTYETHFEITPTHVEDFEGTNDDVDAETAIPAETLPTPRIPVRRGTGLDGREKG